MKILITTILILISNFSIASVNCGGVPERIYAGAHGPNGAGYKYWAVFQNWDTYLIGDHDNELAKSRFALAQVALVSGRQLVISFYNHTDCEQAKLDKAVPTAFSLVK